MSTANDPAYKTIPLNRGKVAIVDPEDYHLVSHIKWRVEKGQNGKLYAASGHRGDPMHRLILGCLPGSQVDHWNGCGLDNRRRNLRIATTSQNGINRPKQKNNTSGYKGVTDSGRRPNRWRAQIWFQRRRITVGNYASLEDAARAYDRKAEEMFGEFAFLNFPNPELEEE